MACFYSGLVKIRIGTFIDPLFGFGDHADLRLTTVEMTAAGTRFCLNERNWYTVPLLGRHNASNATHSRPNRMVNPFGAKHLDFRECR